MRLALLALVLAAPLAACTDDSPSVHMEVLDHDQLLIELVRANPDHHFGTVTARANGTDLGPAEIHPGNQGKLFDQAASGASASFTVPLASLGNDLALEIIDDGEPFTIEVPNVGAPRAIDVSMLQPLHPGDWITASTGVATDSVGGGFTIDTPDQPSCTTQWAEKLADASIEMQLPPQFSDYWYCKPAFVEGAPAHASLGIDLWPIAKATRCDGSGLTCDGVRLHTLHADIDATLQF